MKTQCRSYFKYATLVSFLLAAVFALGGCTNAEKAKAEHLSKGEAYLKESKFQEASIEFRNAIQIDDKLAAAHWGLARAYEGLQRFQESFKVGQLEDPHAVKRRAQRVGHDRITLAQTAGLFRRRGRVGAQSRLPFISAAANSAPRMKTTPE